MRPRRPINTETLQRRFPEVYREFFSRNEIVCSASRSFSYSGDHTVQHGGVRIGQKLPWRTYVGIVRMPPDIIEFSRYLSYETSVDRFVSQEFDETIAGKVVSMLRDIATAAAGSKFPGFRFSVLTEGAFQRGTGNYSSFASALAGALLLYLEQVDPKKIAQWSHVAPSELVRRKELQFDVVFQASLRLEAISEPPVVSGGRSFTNLVASSLPVVYFWTKSIGEAVRAARIKPNDDLTLASPRLFQHIGYAGASLGELLTAGGAPYLPLDVALVYSGVDAMTGYGKVNFQNARETYRQLSHTMRGELLKRFAKLGAAPSFLRASGETSAEGIWQRVLDVSSVMSIEILVRLLELAKKGSGRESFEHFFLRYARYHEWMKILGSYPKVHYAIWRFFAEAASALDTPVGLKALASFGGDILVMTPIGTLRHDVPPLLEKLRRTLKRDVQLSYASWIDGHARDGLVVEQHLTAGVYSPFVSQGGAIVTRSRSGVAVSRAYTLERLEERQRRVDLVLDDVEETITVRGHVLTSKEIHSARATIDILKVLIVNVGKYVPATHLPPSSYVDRNEMQSKILSPLAKVFRRRLKSNLPISLHGSLRKNFRMRLEPSKHTILVVEKRF